VLLTRTQPSSWRSWSRSRPGSKSGPKVKVKGQDDHRKTQPACEC